MSERCHQLCLIFRRQHRGEGKALMNFSLNAYAEISKLLCPSDPHWSHPFIWSHSKVLLHQGKRTTGLVPLKPALPSVIFCSFTQNLFSFHKISSSSSLLRNFVCESREPCQDDHIFSPWLNLLTSQDLDFMRSEKFTIPPTDFKSNAVSPSDDFSFWSMWLDGRKIPGHKFCSVIIPYIYLRLRVPRIFTLFHLKFNFAGNLLFERRKGSNEAIKPSRVCPLSSKSGND